MFASIARYMYLANSCGQVVTKNLLLSMLYDLNDITNLQQYNSHEYFLEFSNSGI